MCIVRDIHYVNSLTRAQNKNRRISYYETLKGGSVLSAFGHLQVRAYTSYAQIPLMDVAVTVTDIGGNAIAMRLTNRSGQFNRPIDIAVPDLSASQTPNTGTIPYATVNLYARAEGYEAIEVEQVQIFANTITEQQLTMIPLSELPGSWNKAEVFITPAQSL